MSLCACSAETTTVALLAARFRTQRFRIELVVHSTKLLGCARLLKWRRLIHCVSSMS